MYIQYMKTIFPTIAPWSPTVPQVVNRAKPCAYCVVGYRCTVVVQVLLAYVSSQTRARYNFPRMAGKRKGKHKQRKTKTTTKFTKVEKVILLSTTLVTDADVKNELLTQLKKLTSTGLLM